LASLEYVSLEHHRQRVAELQHENSQLREQLAKQNQMIEMNDKEILQLHVLLNGTKNQVEDLNKEMETGKTLCRISNEAILEELSNKREELSEKQDRLSSFETKYLVEKHLYMKMLFFSVEGFFGNKNEFLYWSPHPGIDTDLADIMKMLRYSLYDDWDKTSSSQSSRDYLTLWGCWFLHQVAQDNKGSFDVNIVEAGGLTYLSNVIEIYDLSNRRHVDEAEVSRKDDKEQIVPKMITKYARHTLQLLLIVAVDDDVDDDIVDVDKDKTATVNERALVPHEEQSSRHKHLSISYKRLDLFAIINCALGYLWTNMYDCLGWLSAPAA
jgi:hypothetical protein